MRDKLKLLNELNDEELHYHLWAALDPNGAVAADPIEEGHGRIFDLQPNLSTPPEDDSYYQVSIKPEKLNGMMIELRLPVSFLKKMVEAAEAAR